MRTLSLRAAALAEARRRVAHVFTFARIQPQDPHVSDGIKRALADPHGAVGIGGVRLPGTLGHL